MSKRQPAAYERRLQKYMGVSRLPINDRDFIVVLSEKLEEEYLNDVKKQAKERKGLETERTKKLITSGAYRPEDEKLKGDEQDPINKYVARNNNGVVIRKHRHEDIDDDEGVVTDLEYYRTHGIKGIDDESDDDYKDEEYEESEAAQEDEQDEDSNNRNEDDKENVDNKAKESPRPLRRYKPDVVHELYDEQELTRLYAMGEKCLSMEHD